AALRVGNFADHRSPLRHCTRMDDLARRSDRGAAWSEPLGGRQWRLGTEDAGGGAGGRIARTAERGGDARPEPAQSGAPELRIRYQRPVSGLDQSEAFKL